MSIATQVLREYGQAIRGYWGDIDGRTVRSQLNYLADEIDQPTTTSITIHRQRLSICETGGGHWCDPWDGYCTADCGCPCTEVGSNRPTPLEHEEQVDAHLFDGHGGPLDG